MAAQPVLNLNESIEKFAGRLRQGDSCCVEDHRPSCLQAKRPAQLLALWPCGGATGLKELVIDGVWHGKEQLFGHVILPIELTVACANTEESRSSHEQPPVECVAKPPPHGSGRTSPRRGFRPHKHRQSEQRGLAHRLDEADLSPTVYPYRVERSFAQAPAQSKRRRPAPQWQ